MNRDSVAFAKDCIEVIEAFLKGEKIECRAKGNNSRWLEIKNPSWDFVRREYRVKAASREELEKAILDLVEAEKRHSLATMESLLAIQEGSLDPALDKRVRTAFDLNKARTAYITALNSIDFK